MQWETATIKLGQEENLEARLSKLIYVDCFCSRMMPDGMILKCCELHSGHASLAACSQLCHFCKLLTKSLTGAMVGCA